MKPFFTVFFGLIVVGCDKSETKKQDIQLNCGCDTDSTLNVCIDSTGWLAYDSTFKQYSITDTVQNIFLSIYWICNPEIKDVTSISLSDNKPVEVYYSGKIKRRCPDTLLTLPEVFLSNITVDSLRKK